MDGSKNCVRCVVLLLVVVLYITNEVSSKDAFLSCTEEPKKCLRVFQKVNSQLVESVQSNKVKENMDKILDWIDEMSNNDEELTRADFTYLSALFLISNLVHIDGKGVCKLSTAQTLQHNDAALKGAIAMLEPDALPKSRLEKILKHYMEKFFESCDYQQRLKNFDNQKLESIKAIIGELIGTYAKHELEKFNIFGPKIRDPLAYVHDEPIAASSFAQRSMRSLGDAQYALIFYRFLTDELAKEPTRSEKSGTMSDETDVFELLKRYLFNPCEDYVQRLDSVFLNKWTFAQSVKRDKRKKTANGVYKHLAYYHGCKKVLLKKRAISRGVTAIENSY